jgi:hypothetical protein
MQNPFNNDDQEVKIVNKKNYARKRPKAHVLNLKLWVWFLRKTLVSLSCCDSRLLSSKVPIVLEAGSTRSGLYDNQKLFMKQSSLTKTSFELSQL